MQKNKKTRFSLQKLLETKMAFIFYCLPLRAARAPKITEDNPIPENSGTNVVANTADIPSAAAAEAPDVATNSSAAPITTIGITALAEIDSCTLFISGTNKVVATTNTSNIVDIIGKLIFSAVVTPLNTATAKVAMKSID